LTISVGKVIDPESVKDKIDVVLRDVGGVNYPVVCSEVTSGEKPEKVNFELIKDGLSAG